MIFSKHDQVLSVSDINQQGKVQNPDENLKTPLSNMGEPFAGC